nr:pyridoxamine 5'-phosphate oxidase family protein [Paenibacillus caui]
MAPELYDLLSGTGLEGKQGEAMMLLTVSEDGWPHAAMISVGEIVALSGGQLRIGLWPGTTTSGNIRRTGKATLAVIYQGKAHYARLHLQPLEKLQDSKYPRDRYSAGVIAARQDVAKYADIVSGIRISLKEPDEVLARWKDTVCELLRD